VIELIVLCVCMFLSLSLCLSVSLFLEFLQRARGRSLAEWAGLEGPFPAPVHDQSVLSDDSD